MIWSGEEHAQDKNLIWCILMALRPNLLLTVYKNTLYTPVPVPDLAQPQLDLAPEVDPPQHPLQLHHRQPGRRHLGRRV